MKFVPYKIYLHGGPGKLLDGALARHARHGQDAGALFFTPTTPAGRLYAAAYASAAKEPTIWRVRINLPVDSVFDFGKAAHRSRLAKLLSVQEQAAIWQSADDTGQIDWPYIDEEVMTEAGFGGALLSERSSFAGRVMEVHSIAVFNADDVGIVGRVSDADLAKLIRKLNSTRRA